MTSFFLQILQFFVFVCERLMKYFKNLYGSAISGKKKKKKKD